MSDPALAVAGLVAQKVLVVLVLVGVGAGVRRRGLLDGPGTAALSRVVVDLAFPALVLAQLPRTADAAILARAWPLPVLAFGLVAGGTAIGRLLGRGPTEAFLVGLPNWVFLPLLVAPALYGDDGLRTVFLVDAGAQLALWTVGVATLAGRASPRGLANPGLAATLLGLGLALLWPAAAWPLPLRLVHEALGLLGQLAVPLSLLAMGAQLAQAGGGPVDGRALARVLGLRLLLVPALAAPLIAAPALGLGPAERGVLLLTAGMPVAISGSLFTQRFGGDTPLAARAVLASTLVALLTLPLLALAAARFGLL